MVQKKGSRKSRKNIVEPREVVSRDSVGPATGVVGFPVVVILGRPNVGKSTLFNALVGSRRAIVGDEPGITRDRLYHEAGWRGRPFILVDTGGLLPDDKESMPREIMRQAEMALAEADAVLFIVDTQEGLNPLDVDISKIILRSGKPSFLVANKADSPNSQLAANAFYQLGMARVYPVSAEHHLGLDSLLDDLTSPFPEEPPPVGTAGEIRVAIIGRPNVGKSSVVNSMLGTERMIVSEIPGTTRDAVDTELELNGCCYRLIDTAGIRRKGKTKLKAEKISVIQARKHMENADLALLLLDPVEGVTHLDSVIAGYALESGKAIIVGVNKVDLLSGGETARKAFTATIRNKLRFIDYAPVTYFSARTGLNMQKLFPLFQKAHEARNMRVGTGQLNQFYHRMLERRSFEGLQADGAGVKYLTQVKVAPPTFLLFIRKGRKLHFSERRFVINQIRNQFEFFANPIILIERS